MRVLESALNNLGTSQIIEINMGFQHVHIKIPYVVTVLWLDSDDVVTILSPTRNLVEGYKTVYLCHLDSYTVTVCNGASSVFPCSDRAVAY